jgi:hypothetical protein
MKDEYDLRTDAQQRAKCTSETIRKPTRKIEIGAPDFSFASSEIEVRIEEFFFDPTPRTFFRRNEIRGREKHRPNKK